jgi:hypothetical protein
MGGITTRDTAAPCPIPIATSRTGLTADGAVCAPANSLPTSEISDRRAPRAVPAGCRGISAPTGQPDAADQASCHRTRVLPTGLEDMVAPVSCLRVRAGTVPVPAARLDRSARRTAPSQEASGADGTDPRRLPVTEEEHSAEAALHRPVSSATVECAAWAVVAFEAAVVFEAAADPVAAVDAGVNRSQREFEETIGAGLCQTDHCLRF